VIWDTVGCVYKSMTRINVGIHPEELCDQHLIAEYRELPRVIGHTPKAPPPPAFKLGSGHVNWCAQYQHSLYLRQCILCREMKRRGYTVNFEPTFQSGEMWQDKDELHARPLLINRIQERLNTMKRVPTWTNSSKPDWVL